MFYKSWNRVFHSCWLIVLICDSTYCYKKCIALMSSDGFICKCNETYCDTVPEITKTKNRVHHVFTSDDSPGFNIYTLHDQNVFLENAIHLVVNFSYIKNPDLLGFGGTFTDAFGYNLRQLSRKTQTHLLRSYFASDGIKYSLCRTPMGCSDFSTRYYDYSPGEVDSFSGVFKLLPEDYEYKISLFREVKELSIRNVKLIGSNWSPPPWMKMNNRTTPSYLKDKFYQLYADYQVQFLEEYRKEGVEFWGITPVNEPITGLAIHFPITNLIMLPEQQTKFIGENLGPTLIERDFGHIKIIALDDQRKYMNWWMEIIKGNIAADNFTSGVGLHWYYDPLTSPIMMDVFHETYPEKIILYTESSINLLFGNISSKGTHGSGSWFRGALYGKSIIETLNHYSSGWIDWNMGVNIFGGPNYLGLNCDAPIIIDAKEDTFFKQPMFYIIGHFSAFTEPGGQVVGVVKSKNIARRSTPTDLPIPSFDLPIVEEDLFVTAIKNPDGKYVVFILNGYHSSKNITISAKGLPQLEKKEIQATVLGNSINSFIFFPDIN